MVADNKLVESRVVVTAYFMQHSLETSVTPHNAKAPRVQLKRQWMKQARYKRKLYLRRFVN